MAKWPFALVAAALLIGAGGGSKWATDGHRFGGAEYVKTDLVVSVVMYEDLRALRAAMPGGVLKVGRQASSWAIISPGSNRCIIHIMAPQTAYQPELIGHELTHCIHGRWHD